MPHRTDLEQKMRELTDQGLLIEAGWISLRSLAFATASTAELEQLRNAFFAGAQHLLASIIFILEPGTEPTEADLARMDHIDAELKAFIELFMARQLPTTGSA